MSAKKNPKAKGKSKTAKQTEPSPASRTEAALKAIENDHLSFRAACELAGINTGDAWRIMQADQELSTRYARAREARGNAQGEAVIDLGVSVLAGKVPPDVARVALDAMKWSAARMAPKVYGDKVSQEISGPDGAPIKTETTVSVSLDPFEAYRLMKQGGRVEKAT